MVEDDAQISARLLAAYKEELHKVGEKQREEDAKAKAQKDEEDRINAMGFCRKTYTKLGIQIVSYFEEKSGLSEKSKKQLTPFWIRIVGILSDVCFIAILIGFTVTSYSSDQKQKYLSLDSDATDTGSVTSNYRTCKTVPYSITASYTLDTTGLWSGVEDYTPGKGIYNFKLTSFEKSASSYTTFMLDVKSKIKTIAAGASGRNLAGNLAYFMSWTYKKSDTPVSSTDSVTDYITFKADPAFVFDRFYKSASIGAPKSQCKQSPSISYDRPSATFLVQYDYEGYYNTDSYTGCCHPTTSVTVTMSASGCTSTGASCNTGFAGAQYVTLNAAGFNDITKGLYVAGPGVPSGTVVSDVSVSGTKEVTLSNALTQDVAGQTLYFSLISDGVCLLPPGDYGYKPAYDPSHFNVKYNIWTLSTAFAVNQGVAEYGGKDLESFLRCASLKKSAHS